MSRRRPLRQLAEVLSDHAAAHDLDVPALSRKARVPADALQQLLGGRGGDVVHVFALARTLGLQVSVRPPGLVERYVLSLADRWGDEALLGRESVSVWEAQWLAEILTLLLSRRYQAAGPLMKLPRQVLRRVKALGWGHRLTREGVWYGTARVEMVALRNKLRRMAMSPKERR